MGKQDKDLLNATINLYRAASDDKRSTLEEIVIRFANMQIKKPLAHHSRISGKMPSHGSILKGRFKQKAVEEILAEL
jgi:hypothetical protein